VGEEMDVDHGLIQGQEMFDTVNSSIGVPSELHYSAPKQIDLAVDLRSNFEDNSFLIYRFRH
jgi:hypothetical protein